MLNKFVPLAFIVLWIVPVAWVGLMRSSYPLYPAWIAPLFRVTGIFESSPSDWRIFFIEIQDQTGWHYVDERSFFASTPLGNRSRFQPLMNEIKQSQPEQAQELLEWIASHLAKGDQSCLEAKRIRIVHFGIPSEFFLKHKSLADVYQVANESNLPRVVVASLNIPSSSLENP